MPLLFFVEIGLLAGIYGLMGTVSAVMNLKNARKVNEKANELLRNTSARGELMGTVYKLEPMMPALKKGVLMGVRTGILAAFGACGVAGILAMAGRICAFYFGGTTEKCTILAILGDGSLAVEAAVLACIIVGTSGAVLGLHAKKKAETNCEMAYSNLFQAKRIRRERCKSL